MANPSKDNFYSRLRELAGTSKDKKVNESQNSTLINYEKAADGSSLGVIKENHHYYIKKTNKKENLSESDFAYIGGVENKTKYRYDSLSEAEKQRNFFVKSLNESFSLDSKPKLNENKKVSPSLETSDDVNSFIKNRISEGKVQLKEGHEERFKSSLRPKQGSKKELNEMNQIRVRMGLQPINEEEDLSTQDSEQDTEQSVVTKGEKPVTNSKDLSTADSEIEDGDVLPNKTNVKKGEPQAPIDDANAKAEAEKHMAKDSKMFEKPSQSGSLAVSETKDISTEDSLQDTDDSVANSKKVIDKPDAPYNSYNQPEKGQKEEKGEELKPKASKEDIVAEGDKTGGKVLSTADSNIKEKDSLVNQTKAKDPKHGKDLSTEDSELDAEDTIANKKKDLKTISSNHGEALSTKDSQQKKKVNETLEEDEEVDADLDKAADALQDLEDAPEEGGSEETPDMDVDAPEEGGSEETPDVDVDADGEETPDVDVDTDGGEEVDVDVDTDGGEEGDPIKELIQKYAGKITQKAGTAELDPEFVETTLSSLIGGFKDEIGQMDQNEKKALADKILKQKEEGGEEADTDVSIDVETGMDSDTESELNDKINNLKGEGETQISEEGNMCAECGPFVQYAESRGYTMNELHECPPAEMANLISGYKMASDDGMNDGDPEGVAVFVSPEVETELDEGYGLNEYIDELKPFIQKINEKKEMYEEDQANPKDRDMARQDISQEWERESEYTDFLVKMAKKHGISLQNLGTLPDKKVKEFFNKVDQKWNAQNESSHMNEADGEEEMNMEEPSPDLGMDPAAVEPMPNITEPVDGPEIEAEIQTEPSFIGGADVMGAGTPLSSDGKTSVKVENGSVHVENDQVSLEVNEQEEKLRKLVRYKIQEQLGKRKPTINESKKTKTSKLLDKLVSEQLNVYKNLVDKKINGNK